MSLNWYKTAKTENFNSKIKSFIKKDPFFIKLFNKHSIPIDMIDDNLTFYIRKLTKKKAKSDSNSITFNSTIFENDDFFKNKVHYLAHELYHWIARQKENAFYFADPEEMEAFSEGMAYEIVRGKSFEEIIESYYNIIKDHFNEEKDAKKIFLSLYEIAKSKAKEYLK